MALLATAAWAAGAEAGSVCDPNGRDRDLRALTAAATGGRCDGTTHSRLKVRATADRAPADYAKALKWYRAAADQGCLEAMDLLGFLYATGKGVRQDYAAALRWQRKAADGGLANGQHDLGVMYANGRGVPKNYQEAARWYRMAAEQGFADSQVNLGALYEDGNGVEKSEEKAMDWYRKAAEQSHVNGQHNLGRLYDAAGKYAEAFRWYKRAAEQGDSQALYNLALMQHAGEGVPRDDAEAYVWASLAVSLGAGDDTKGAAQLREELAAKLSPAALARAEERCRDWIAALEKRERQKN